MEALPLFIQDDNEVTGQRSEEGAIFRKVAQGSLCKAKSATVSVAYFDTHCALPYCGLKVAGYLESLVAPGTSNERIRDRDIGADYHGKQQHDEAIDNESTEALPDICIVKDTRGKYRTVLNVLIHLWKIYSSNNQILSQRLEAKTCHKQKSHPGRDGF